MATKVDVRNELLTATRIAAKDGEEESALARRVAEHISEKMSEEDYHLLSAPSTTWYEKALAKIEKEEEVLLPSGSNGADGPQTAAPSSTAPKKATAKKEATVKKTATKKTDPKKTTAAAKKTAAAPKKEKVAKAAKPPKEKKEPRVSGTKTAIEMICKKPTITLEELATKLAEKDITLGPLPAVYQRAKLVIKTLGDLGKLA